MKQADKSILFVSSKPPLPAVDGGTVAALHALRLLQKCGFKLSVVFLTTPKHTFVSEVYPKKDFPDILPIHCNTRTNLKDVWRFISGKSIKMSRFYHFKDSIEQKNNIKNKRVDFVWCDGLFAFPLAEKLAGGKKIIYHAHNIEYEVVKQQAATESNAIKKMIFKKEWKLLKKTEEKILNQVSGAVAVSKTDAARIIEQTKTPAISLLPLTLNLQKPPHLTRTKHQPLKLFHIGAMDWQPNVDGILYFLQEVWPVVLKHFPQMQFHFAGKAMSERLAGNLPKGVFCHGTVADANQFINSYDVMIAPIRIASGVRIKILEAIKLGKPVLSTDAGILGLPLQAGKDYFKVSEPITYVQALEKLNHTDVYQKMAVSAYETLQKEAVESNQQKKLTQYILSIIIPN